MTEFATGRARFDMTNESVLSKAILVILLGHCPPIFAEDCTRAEDRRPIITLDNLSRLHSHTGEFHDAVMSQEGKFMAVLGEDKTLKMWDVRQRRMHRMQLKYSSFRQGRNLAFSEDGKLFAMSFGSGIELFDSKNGRQVRFLADALSSSLIFLPDSRTLVACGTVEKKERGATVPYLQIQLWDTVTSRLQGQLHVQSEGRVYSLASSRDGRLLAVGTGYGSPHEYHFGGSVLLIDLAKRQAIQSPRLQLPGWIVGVNFSPDGKAIAFACGDRSLHAHEVLTLRKRFRVAEDFVSVPEVMYTPNGRWIVFTTLRSLRFLDSQSGIEKGRLNLPGKFLAIARDFTCLATTPEDGPEDLINVWSVRFAKEGK